MPERHRIVMCAKSRWDPPIRREHGLAFAAARDGHLVEFVEHPRDVRDLHPRGWRSGAHPAAGPMPDGVRLTSPFTPVPGHRNTVAHRIETLTLRRTLAGLLKHERQPAAIVVNAPWNWVASAIAPPGTRRVLDLGDDWARLLPHRREAMLEHYRRISAEADAIVVVAPSLAELFDRPVSVIPNAVAPEVLATPPGPPPGTRRLVYVGTLSERFDTALVSDVMRRLPEWSLDLYGPCHYAGHGASPDASLTALLDTYAGRARWHGVVPRAELSAVLDNADVLVLPNDATISAGQDSMKLYDYAARGRPIVATPIRLPATSPPALRLAADPSAFAEAIQEIAEADASGNRAWAEANSWSSRMPAWLAEVAGDAHRPA